MTAEEIKKAYLTVPQIMAICGTDRNTVYNWAKYHRYFDFENILDRPVVRREEFEQFALEHPELVKAKEVA